MKTLSLVLFLLSILDTEAISGDYEPNMFQECDVSGQSPIDIISSDAKYNDKLHQLKFSDSYEVPMVGAMIFNTGKTIQISPGFKDRNRTIDGGGLDEVYHFEKLHFHWGNDSKKGSEHLINGQALPLEIQIIHRNKDYQTLETVIDEEDKFAILSILFKLDDEDNPFLDPINRTLYEILKRGYAVQLHDFQLSSLLPNKLMPYYRYQGSFTTPPCYEVVTWTVFKDYAPISEKQLKEFRKILTEGDEEYEKSLVNKSRPVQPLYGRVVYISAEEDDSAASIPAPTAILALSIVTFFLVRVPSGL